MVETKDEKITTPLVQVASKEPQISSPPSYHHQGENQTITPSQRCAYHDDTNGEVEQLSSSFPTSIPPELFETILSCLALRDLYKCFQLSRSITRFIRGSVRIQYATELCLTHQEENARRAQSMPISEKLRILRRLRLGWINGNVAKWEQLFQCASLRHIDLYATRLTYLARDLFVQGENINWKVGADMSVVGGPPASQAPSFVITAVALASDSSQSLLIAIRSDGQQAMDAMGQRFRIEPLSLATALRRPDITPNPIYVGVPLTHHRKEFAIDIWEDWVLVIIRWMAFPGGALSRCFLRNWRTGTGVDCDGFELLYARFLDSSTILAVRNAQESLGDIVRCKFDSNTGRLSVSHVFQPPQAHGPVEIMTISTPRVSWKVTDEATEDVLCPLFRPRSHGGVVAFSLGMRATWPGPLPYTLIVQATTFLNASELFPATPFSTTADLVEVAWEEWGPTQSRLLNGGRLPTIHSAGLQPHGHRYPLLVNVASGTPSSLRILDFNPIPCTHQGITDDAKRSDKHFCVSDPQTIYDPIVWGGAITTGLPYCYGEIKGDFGTVKDVIMDSEKLVLTKECGAGVMKVEAMWM